MNRSVLEQTNLLLNIMLGPVGYKLHQSNAI